MANRRHDELIVREGWPFVIPLLAFFVLAVALKLSVWLITAAGVLTCFVTYFFRNPYRQIPQAADVIVAPADGKVVAIDRDHDTKTTVSIFLNIFNVHVNRAPIGGNITRIEYRPGRFFTANQARASVENERNEVVIEDGDFSVKVTQIAGAIARRIVCWKRDGASIQSGERLGLIRFGSRVDLELPKTVDLVVRIGQKVRGGADVMAHRK